MKGTLSCELQRVGLRPSFELFVLESSIQADLPLSSLL